MYFESFSIPIIVLEQENIEIYLILRSCHAFLFGYWVINGSRDENINVELAPL